MSTWCRYVHVRPHCFVLTKVCSCRLELAYSRGKYLKIDWSVKMPLHLLIMGVAGSSSNGLLSQLITTCCESTKLYVHTGLSFCIDVLSYPLCIHKLLFNYFQDVLVTTEKFLPKELKKIMVQWSVYYHQHKVDDFPRFRQITAHNVDWIKLKSDLSWSC